MFVVLHFDEINLSSMEKILERYERYSYAERQLTGNDSELQVIHLQFLL